MRFWSLQTVSVFLLVLLSIYLSMYASKPILADRRHSDRWRSLSSLGATAKGCCDFTTEPPNYRPGLALGSTLQSFLVAVHVTPPIPSMFPSSMIAYYRSSLNDLATCNTWLLIVGPMVG